METLWLVYDGECPLCSAWCKHARVREAVGELVLVDAREPGPLMDEITALGLDIDQGMVLKFRDVLYYGPDDPHGQPAQHALGRLQPAQCLVLRRRAPRKLLVSDREGLPQPHAEVAGRALHRQSRRERARTGLTDDIALGLRRRE